jgi:RNA polymerase sigma-70 factor (ECF subfamily)
MRDGTVVDGELEPELERAGTDASAAWPGVRLEVAALAPALAREIERAGDKAPSTVLRDLHVRDLYLACACAAGDAAALRAVEVHCGPAIRDVVRRIRPSPQLCEETAQVTRELLFVRRGDSAPKVARYSGRGDLRSWTMVVAAREAVRLCKSDAREQPVDATALADMAERNDADVELEYVKHAYRPQFEQALRDALAELPPRDRTVLKYHYVDGLNGRRIAALYKVHPATVTRWLESARLALASLTRALLERRLGLGEREIESIERLVRSQLELSLSRHLTGTRDP